jgi:hypothetical protein
MTLADTTSLVLIRVCAGVGKLGLELGVFRLECRRLGEVL